MQCMHYSRQSDFNDSIICQFMEMRRHKTTEKKKQQNKRQKRKRKREKNRTTQLARVIGKEGTLTSGGGRCWENY